MDTIKTQSPSMEINTEITQFISTNQQSLAILAFGILVLLIFALGYKAIAKKLSVQSADGLEVAADGFNHHRLVIEAGRIEQQYWKDLWNYRGLFYFLAWRDILVRYKQTVIGIAWALIRPLLTMIIFSVIFGKLAKLPSNNVPYPIMVFSAMLPWQYFANALTECSNSLIGNANLVSKVYFPRLIVPTSAVVVSFIDFLISSSILIVLMIWYQFLPSWNLLILPVLIIMVSAAALGCGLWFAALNIKYRDFRFIVPFVVQFGLYVSPVGFSSDIVPEEWRTLYALNPMVGIIDGFRWSILGNTTGLNWESLAISLGMIIFLLSTGIWYFRKTERTFADII